MTPDGATATEKGTTPVQTRLLHDVESFLSCLAARCKECLFRQGASSKCDDCWSPSAKSLLDRLCVERRERDVVRDEELRKAILARVARSAPRPVRAADIRLGGIDADHKNRLLMKLVSSRKLVMSRILVGGRSAYAYTTPASAASDFPEK